MSSESSLHGQAGRKRSVRERLGALSRAAVALAATRLAIFREELGAKATLLTRAAIGLALALALGSLGLLLATALIAALLAHLLRSVVAGLSAALVLYLAAAAAAGLLGWRALSRVRVMDFPLTAGELRKDWKAAADSAGFEGVDSESGDEEGEDLEDLEERFRAGSE